MSSCEAELVALSAAACDVIWLRNLLAEIGFPVSGATPIYCDNTAAKAVAENPVAAKSLKHVARRHFFVRELVQNGKLNVTYISTDDNVADIFTKPLDKTTFLKFRAGLLHLLHQGLHLLLEGVRYDRAAFLQPRARTCVHVELE